MKINCPEKLYKALKFAREKDEQARQNLKRSIFKAYAKLDKGEIEEAKAVLESVYNGMNGDGAQSLTHSITCCLERVACWESAAIERGSYDTEYSISSDFGEHTFFFAEHKPGANDCGLCGGIVYHGCPEEGWKENGSVSFDQSFGWQIHT